MRMARRGLWRTTLRVRIAHSHLLKTRTSRAIFVYMTRNVRMLVSATRVLYERVLGELGEDTADSTSYCAANGCTSCKRRERNGPNGGWREGMCQYA